MVVFPRNRFKAFNLRKRSPFLVFSWMILLGIIGGAYRANAGETSPSQDLLEAGFTLMEQEAIGELRLGLKGQELPHWLTTECTVKRDREQYWGATGNYHQAWTYGDCGIQLIMMAEQPNTERSLKVIDRIEIFSPSLLKTVRGIGIGSPWAEVQAAYGAYADPETPHPSSIFIAGTPYGGLFFFFQGGKVYRIFLGAAAE